MQVCKRCGAQAGKGREAHSYKLVKEDSRSEYHGYYDEYVLKWTKVSVCEICGKQMTKEVTTDMRANELL